MIRFELPDGAVKEFSSPVAASEVVRSISCLLYTSDAADEL